MSSAFDAYFEWLDIPPSQQPPNYYRLLGIAPFEANAAAIAAAAEQRSASVRQHLNGSRGALAQKLLKQIETVRDHLLSAEKKAAYDAALRQKHAAAQPAPLQAVPAGKNADAPVPSSSPDAVKAAAAPQKIKILGEYLIMAKIAAGGMGQVYKAQHQRMRRIVALKILPPQAINSPNSVRRFNREVQAAARLSHPNIVTAFDAGEQQGVHYLVMEYVSGSDLSTLVREHGPLDVEAALDCVLQTARGLEYAHSEGIVHRDIKPSNLLVDKRGTVKILDMGLARFDDALGNNEALTGEGLTRTEQIMGTVDFMSPEQAEDTRCADARSDIYSLGCTMYSLLTGAAPFPGDTVMKRLMAHRVGSIPELAAQRQDIPKHLDEVFRRMVAKDPGDRFQSMTEVIEALEQCQAQVCTAVEIGTNKAADRSSFWNLLKGRDRAVQPRSSTFRGRSQEATVELRDPNEETTPRLLRFLVSTVHRKPVAIIASTAGVILIAAAALWLSGFGTSSPGSIAEQKSSEKPSRAADSTASAAIAEAANGTSGQTPEKEEWLDVLAVIDLVKDSPRRGTWSRDGSGLQYAAQAGIVGLLPLPVSISGSYRCQMEISGWGSGIGPLLSFPVGTSAVRLMLDGRNQSHVAGLERVKSWMLAESDNPTATTFRIEPGTRYLLELAVEVTGQDAKIDVQIDGKPLVEWSGPVKELSLPGQGNSTSGPQLFGVRPYTIYGIKLQSKTGGFVKLAHAPPGGVRLPSFVRAPQD